MNDEQNSQKRNIQLIGTGITLAVVVAIGVVTWVVIDKVMTNQAVLAEDDLMRYARLSRTKLEPTLPREILSTIASRRSIDGQTLESFSIYTEDSENEKKGEFVLTSVVPKVPYDRAWLNSERNIVTDLNSETTTNINQGASLTQ